MIEYRDVSVSAGGRKILTDVTLAIATGEKAVIAGPTGAGKSALLLTLLGAYELSGGAIGFDGSPVTASRLAAVRRSVAYIGQEPVLGDGTVREAMLLPFRFAANRAATPDERHLEEVLSHLHLEPAILDRRTSVVSGGEKQRIAIARALVLGKEVFLADEITSALDTAGAEVVMDLFRRGSYTVIAVSHDPVWHQRFGTRISMEAGRILEVRR